MSYDTNEVLKRRTDNNWNVHPTKLQAFMDIPSLALAGHFIFGCGRPVSSALEVAVDELRSQGRPSRVSG